MMETIKYPFVSNCKVSMIYGVGHYPKYSVAGIMQHVDIEPPISKFQIDPPSNIAEMLSLAHHLVFSFTTNLTVTNVLSLFLYLGNSCYNNHYACQLVATTHFYILLHTHKLSLMTDLSLLGPILCRVLLWNQG